MGYIEDIKKLEAREILSFTILFLAIISSGFLLLYLYKPELLIKLETVKLILFSIALSLPVFILNLFIIAPAMHDEKSTNSTNDDILIQSVVSAFISFIILYVTIIISYIFTLKFTIYLSLLITCEVILLIIVFIGKRILPKL